MTLNHSEQSVYSAKKEKKEGLLAREGTLSTEPAKKNDSQVNYSPHSYDGPSIIEDFVKGDTKPKAQPMHHGVNFDAEDESRLAKQEIAAKHQREEWKEVN